MKKINPRYPISAALTEEFIKRVEKLREKGWKISEILKAGIEAAEKKK